MSDQVLVGRSPQQQRSRERVERILSAAVQLIAARGSEALKMGELAQQAGISIGSLYQYFPEKSAVIAALAERYYDDARICIRNGLDGVDTVESLRQRFSELVDTYYGLFLTEPVMRDVWSGVQADKSLQAIDLADSRANGELLAGVIKRLFPMADPAELESKAMLIMYLGTATMRLAVSLGRAEGDRLVEDFKRLALRDLTGEL